MIYIGASQGISLSSKMIQLQQFGFPVTHIFYAFDDDKLYEDPLVVEAQRKGVTFNRFSEYHHKGTKIQIYSIEATEKQKEIVEDFLLDQVGKGYDFLGILGFPLRNKKFQRENRQFCSELIYAALLEAGIELFRNTDKAEVSPQLFVKSPLLKLERHFELSTGL